MKEAQKTRSIILYKGKSVVDLLLSSIDKQKLNKKNIPNDKNERKQAKKVKIKSVNEK